MGEVAHSYEEGPSSLCSWRPVPGLARDQRRRDHITRHPHRGQQGIRMPTTIVLFEVSIPRWIVLIADTALDMTADCHFRHNGSGFADLAAPSSFR